MSPIKSTFGRSVSKLLGVFRNNDLTLSGQRTNRYIAIISATGGTTATYTDPATSYQYTSHTFTSPGDFIVNSIVYIIIIQ